MRRLTLALVATAMLGLGCGSTGGGAPAEAPAAAPDGSETTVDGLVRVDIDGPGKLFLREDHGIGGYDAIAVAPAFVTYRRTSAKLDPDTEDVYLVSLEQAILDVAEAAAVPVVNELGECVIKIGAGFANVDLARSDSAKVLGRMTMIVEYQDSMSGQSLLRYALDGKVDRESGDTSRQEQVRNTFDEMIADMNIITALRKATVVPSPPRAGCNGDLVRARGPEDQ